MLLVLFFFVALGCLAWTTWLAVLAIDPRGTVNRTMGTVNFDNGSFWFMLEPPRSLVLYGVAGLALVAAGNLFTLQ